MKRRLLRCGMLAPALLLGGCNVDLEPLFNYLSGHEVNVVILSAQPASFAPQPSTLTATDPMKVVGEQSMLCFVLKDDVPLQPQHEMQRIFNEQMGGAKVDITLTLSGGQRVPLYQPMQAWRKFGRILKTDELSGCASTPAKSLLPAGAIVSKIEVAATPGFRPQGVYWESEKAALEK